MRVLFTHSYFLKFYPKQWKQMHPYAPLGTLYAASLLRKHGIEVSLRDVMFSNSPASIEYSLKTFKPEILVIYDDGFNYLTKMCLTNMRYAALEMSNIAKDHGCIVIVCSSDAMDHFNKYLDNHADFILSGEGEQTLLELVQAIKIKETNYNEIAGIVFRDENGVTKHTLPRKVMHYLDSLPLPAWDLIDIEQYRNAWINSEGYFSIVVSTTRGCPFKCNWCAKPIYGNRYNVRSPQHVVNELLYLKEKSGFDHVWFCDDIFGLKPGWIKEFSELVKKHNLKFRFKIQSRADMLLKEGQIEQLQATGCDTVWIGAESGSQKILDAMDKGITTKQISEATRLLKQQGMQVAYFLQFGYPGETKEDIDKTLKMLYDNRPDDIGISVSYPLPGTLFYDRVSEQLKNKANWTDSDDLTLMFKNTFDTAFYRYLHRYVHAYFRKLKAASNPVFSFKQVLKVPYYSMQEVWYKRLLNKH